ncbi:MAG: hypothetical protein Q9219_007317 [cf. Caloplaca sp. 3 TL-2023]
MSKSRIKLTTKKHWDLWFAAARAEAIGYQIWEFIDPDKDQRPVFPPEPTMSDPDIPKNISKADLERAKIEFYFFKIRYKEWIRQRDSLKKITDFIFETISAASLRHIILTCEVHPWNYLRKLRRMYGPLEVTPKFQSKEVRNLSMEE